MEITNDIIKLAIARATEVAEQQKGFKSETYLGVLMASLLAVKPQPMIKELSEQSYQPIEKKQSIGELFAEKKPGSDVQKVLVAGYFLEKRENVSSFNVGDLARCFLQAKERPPTNINDAVNKNIIKGLIMEAKEKKGGKKAWILTRTGEGQVEGEGE